MSECPICKQVDTCRVDPQNICCVNFNSTKKVKGYKFEHEEVRGKGYIWVKETTDPGMLKREFIQTVSDIEREHGFLTSDYYWELENLADQLKRSSKFLQNVYNRHLSEKTDGTDRLFSEVCQNAPEDIPWLISDLLYRGGTTIFHAAGGCGKTLLTYNLIRSLSQGEEFLGNPVVEKVRCGLIQVDEPERIFIERARELGLHETDNLIILDWSFALVSNLDDWIERNKLGLVVIDSFFAAQKFAETRENDADHASILMRLRDTAQRTNCAIVIVHHSNKNGGARGSSAITGAASEVWHLTAPVPEKHEKYHLKPSERIFEAEKTRLCTPFRVAIDLDPDTLEWRNLGDLTKIDNGTIDQPASWFERIKAYLETTHELFTVSDLLNERTMLGLERNTAQQNLKRLQKKGFVFAAEPSLGRSETKWISTRARIARHGVRVQPETHAESGTETVTHDRDNTVTLIDFVTDNNTVTNVICHGIVTDAVTVNKPLLSNGSSPNRDTCTRKNEIFLRHRDKKEESSTGKRSKSLRTPYSGPPVGSVVMFEKKDLSRSEIKKLEASGTLYPWNDVGEVKSYFEVGTKGYGVTVKVGDRTYVVENLLALEVLETPSDF